MKLIKIKFKWRGKRKVWYPLQTITVAIILMLAFNIITTVTNKPESVTEYYVSRRETLWDIYDNKYNEVDICWDKFSYEVKALNGKKTFNEGEIIFLPIYNK